MVHERGDHCEVSEKEVLNFIGFIKINNNGDDCEIADSSKDSH